MCSTTKPNHLGVEDMSGDVLVLIECGSRLKSAPFKDNGKFETIDNGKVFEEASRDFRKIQSTKPDCRLIAWRFPKPTTLSIPAKVTLDIIPCEISGTPKVGGELVKVGQSIHLTKDVEVQPSFTCLVRVYGPAS